MHTTKTYRNEWLVLGFFVLLKMVLQYLLINPAYDLHRDEYLHIDQGYHLAWGYISVPPFTSWVSYLIIALGNSVFWVKFFPALFGALTIVVVWFTVKTLKGGLFAQVAAATALTFSVLLRINLLYQPNSFDILSFTLVYFSLIRYAAKRQPKWLLWGAVFFALGFLNKYNILFLIAGLFPALLLSEHRKLFISKSFYIAVVLAFILILPNLLWQYHNGFPVVYHMKELAASQLVHVDRSDFLMQQALFFFSAFFILVLAFLSFFAYAPFKPYRFVFWSYVFTICLFVFFRAKGYYAIGLYPVLMAFGSVYLEKLLSKGKRYYLKPVLVVLLMVALFAPQVPVLFPIAPPQVIEKKSQRFQALGLLKWEDGKDHILPQDFADMLGWSELATKVERVYDSLPDKKHTLIITDNYGQAGAINYYSDNRLGAVSFNADYINWFPLHRTIKHIIRIKTDGGINDFERSLFKHLSVEGRIENRYAREYGTSIFLFTDGVDSLNQVLKRLIAEEKSESQ